jgi:molybdenum cofactor cytidylyltransferase
MKKVSAILLGAGESKRMGVNKLTLPWGKETVLDRCLETLLKSRVQEVVVVLSPRTNRSVAFMKCSRMKVVLNPHFKRGMSTSIQKGLKAINPKSEGILIALGDQPFLKPRTVNALINAYVRGKGRIIVPSYKGQKGHPVLFDRHYRRELLKLRGDVGGRSVIERHAKEVMEVRTRSKSVVKDLDIWKDYEREWKVAGGKSRRNMAALR